MNTYAKALNLHAHRRWLLTNVGSVISANLLLIVAAKTRIPLGYVDLSLQSLLVPLLSLVMGRKLAFAAVVMYMMEGIMGVPVFQGTPERGSGLIYMSGATGGYLLGFLVVQMVPISRAIRAGGKSSFAYVIAHLAMSHAVIHVLGIAWLSVLFGINTAIAIDMPFWLGSVAKILVGAGFMSILLRGKRDA